MIVLLSLVFSAYCSSNLLSRRDEHDPSERMKAAFGAFERYRLEDDTGKVVVANEKSVPEVIELLTRERRSYAQALARHLTDVQLDTENVN